MKNKSVLTLLGMLCIGLAFMALTGCVTIDSVGSEKKAGTFETAALAGKDYDTVSMVFTESVINSDAKGSRGQVFIYQALLKEAQKLGADAIINVVIDVAKEGHTEKTNFFGFKSEKLISGTETWYGSALAIKYTEARPDAVAAGGSDGGSGGGTPGDTKSKKAWYKPWTWFKK